MFANRNRRMDQYEKMYRLNIWPDSRNSDEVRVTLPLAYDAVEKMRALLITRPPTVSVPYTSNNVKDQARGQKLERFIYGAMARMSFQKLLADAEWYAMCLGRGWLKIVYDSEAAEIDEDFPLVLTSPDPRTVYYQLSPRRDRCVELVQKWERSRREIQDEFGYEFARPSGIAGDLAQVEVWLDQKVEYIEYWREVTTWKTEKKEPPPPEPKLMTDMIAEKMMALVTGEEPPEDKPPVDVEPERRKVRQVVHAIMVNDASATEFGKDMIKKPTIMFWHKKIPFFGWAGTSTPLAGSNGDLSVLFPLSNGDGGDKAMGILGALSMLASTDLQIGINSPSAPIISDDPDAEISLDPNAINYVKPGTKVDRLTPDGTNPAILRTSELLNQQVSRVTVPQVMSGDYLNLSGQAVSGLSSAYQMLLGFRQQERETQLQYLFGEMLAVAEELATDMGWTAYGNNALGRYVEQKIVPADISGNTRVTVKLSASMPKDTMGQISTLSMLQKSGQISMETFLDMVQKLPDMGLAAESPTDEIERILRDKIMFEGELAKGLATGLVAESVEDMMGRSGFTFEQVMAMRSLMYPQPKLPPQMMPPQGGPPGMGAGPNGQPPMPMDQPMPGGGGPPPPPGVPTGAPPMPEGMPPEMMGGQ